MEDAKMKTRIIHSKAGVSTTERITVRILIHFLPIAVAIHRSMQVHLHTQRIAIILIGWQERNSKCSSGFLLLITLSWKAILRFFASVASSKSRKRTHAIDVFSFTISPTANRQFIDVADKRVPRSFWYPILGSRKRIYLR